MALRIINDVIVKFCEHMKINTEDVKIQTIDIVDDYGYTVILQVDNKKYSIQHGEPRVMLPNVNYGMGYYHTYHIFNEVTGVYENFDNNDQFEKILNRLKEAQHKMQNYTDISNQIGETINALKYVHNIIENSKTVNI